MGREVNGEIRFRKIEATPGFSGQALVEAIEGAYLQKRRPNKFTQKKTFSPSSIGYGHAVCPRYWFLAFTGGHFVETNDAKSVAVMENGTKSHERIQAALKDAGVLVAEEVEIKLTDPPVRGYMDVLIRMGNDTVVGEIKTTSQEIFNLKQLSMKPSANHLFQILIYMKATGKKRGFLLYENRNDLSILVIEVNFNEKNEAILEQALDWMRLVYKSWEDGVMPMRPFRNQTGKVCMSCPLNKVCWEDTPEGTARINKMEVPKV